MGTPSHISDMATSQSFLLLLCVSSMAVAAPQVLISGGTRSASGATNSEQQVVSSVITALGPSISKAVEDALAGLSGSSSISGVGGASSGTRPITGFSGATSVTRPISGFSGATSGARPISSFSGATSLAGRPLSQKDSFDAEVSASLGPQARPEYNFEYKVADEEAQTYISRAEQRDGDELTGKYSYVDATGALVNVEYQAGEAGYTETRTREPGLVAMRAIPPWTGPLAGVDDASISGSTAARDTLTSTQLSTSSSRGQSDLISSILAALQPQIQAAVTQAIGSN